MDAVAGPPVDSYFDRRQLAQTGAVGDGAPSLFEGAKTYDEAVFADGALDAREKGLIALACGHAIQCPYSIDHAVQRLRQLDVSLEEMTEAVHVATAIRGGASLVHGLQMLEQVTTAQD